MSGFDDWKIEPGFVAAEELAAMFEGNLRRIAVCRQVEMGFLPEDIWFRVRSLDCPMEDDQ